MKTISFLLVLLISNICFAEGKYVCNKGRGCIDYTGCRPDFALKLCKTYPDIYECIRFKKHSQHYITWEEAFPNPKTRTLIQKVNRRNSLIWRNHCVAKPHDYLNHLDDELYYAPFEKKIKDGEKQIIIDLNLLALGAYSNGKLVFWTSANGGKGRCDETGEYKCKTPIGIWKVLRKGPPVSRSLLYPVECRNKKLCGHPLFWKVQFHINGTEIHGDKHLPGFNASHGCVRVDRTYAKFINNFVDIGTKIIILPY